MLIDGELAMDDRGHFLIQAVCTVVHRVAVGWCLGDSFCDCMYYPKADYLEEVKSITSSCAEYKNEI